MHKLHQELRQQVNNSVTCFCWRMENRTCVLALFWVFGFWVLGGWGVWGGGGGWDNNKPLLHLKLSCIWNMHLMLRCLILSCTWNMHLMLRCFIFSTTWNMHLMLRCLILSCIWNMHLMLRCLILSCTWNMHLMLRCFIFSTTWNMHLMLRCLILSCIWNMHLMLRCLILSTTWNMHLMLRCFIFSCTWNIHLMLRCLILSCRCRNNGFERQNNLHHQRWCQGVPKIKKHLKLLHRSVNLNVPTDFGEAPSAFIQVGLTKPGPAWKLTSPKVWQLENMARSIPSFGVTAQSGSGGLKTTSMPTFLGWQPKRCVHFEDHPEKCPIRRNAEIFCFWL